MNLRKIFGSRTAAIASASIVGIVGLVPAASAADPPPNDSFMSPTQIVALPFSQSLDISGATEEIVDSASCPASKTVWYEITAPSTRPIVIDTSQSDFETQILVSNGNLPVPVPANCQTTTSYTLYPAAVSQKYRIRIGADDPEAAGVLSLSVYEPGSIRGRVVDEAGDPVPDIEVFIQTVSSPWNSDWTYTDDAGTYEFPVVMAGTYRVSFWDASGKYLYSWYHNTRHYLDSAAIEVTSDPVLLQDQTVIRGGIIEGTFTSSDGGQPAACIFAYASAGWIASVAYVDAGESTFSLTGLQSDTYKLQAQENCSGVPYGMFNEEWYENVTEEATATPIDVEAGQTLTGIEVIVDPAPVPSNDERAGAIELGTLPAQISQGLGKATSSASDPAECGIVGATTWYSYDAPEDEQLFISASRYNASIAVHAEAENGSLSLVGCSSTTDWTSARLSLEEGTRYLFQVGVTETGVPAGIRASLFGSDGGGTMTFEPKNPCHIQCPYWNQERTATQKREDACAPTPASPEGSWEDRHVEIPATVNDKVPYALGFTMDPTVDHDVWFCRVEPDAQGSYLVTYAANYVTDRCDYSLPLGCSETFQASVEPGKEYIIRVYNWSDPSPVTGTYWYLAREGLKATSPTPTG